MIYGYACLCRIYGQTNLGPVSRKLKTMLHGRHVLVFRVIPSALQHRTEPFPEYHILRSIQGTDEAWTSRRNRAQAFSICQLKFTDMMLDQEELCFFYRLFSTSFVDSHTFGIPDLTALPVLLFVFPQSHRNSQIFFFPLCPDCFNCRQS